jgi:hypothetical protein
MQNQGLVKESANSVDPKYSYAKCNASVTVRVNVQQKITLLYKDNPLPYTVFPKQAKQ